MRILLLATTLWGFASAANDDIKNNFGTTLLTLDFILAVSVIFALFSVSIYSTIAKNQKRRLFAKYTVSLLLR